MDKSDARRLPLALLNERRRRAVKLRERGLMLRQVAAEVELSVPTVIAAHRAYRAGGCIPVMSRSFGNVRFLVQA